MHIWKPEICSNMLEKYYCEKCDYKCSRLFLWKQHLMTRKHQMETNGTPLHPPTLPTKNSKNVCYICGKSYKYRSGLWKHNQKCKQTEIIVADTSSSGENDLKSLIYEMVKGLQHDAEIKKEMMQQLKEQQLIIKEMVPKIGNTQLNINVFLNDRCRDAINMTDFIDSLNIQMPDLLYTRENGLAQGITSVFVNHLRQLDTFKRPIHCTDTKRETLYIKNNDSWEQDNDNTGLRIAINDIAIKHRKAISEWERDHPNWSSSEKGKEDYVLLVKSVMEDAKNSTSENIIIKNIAKETIINNKLKNIVYK